MSTPQTGLRESRPAFNVDGSDVPSLAGGLMRLLIAEDTSGLYRCEACFGNLGNKDNTIDFLYFDRRTLDFGKQFKVKLGDNTLFDGRITALQAGFPEGQAPELSVLAEDRLQDLRMKRRTRTFSDVSDSDAITQIANDHGLTPDVNLTGPTYKILSQVNQSDLAFIRDRVRSIDAEVWVNGSTLHAKHRSARNEGMLEMSYGNSLRSFSVTADLSCQRTSVTASGWDVSSKSAITHEATDSVISGELNGDTSGISILSSALGDRKESIVHTVPLNSQEAQLEAESLLKMSARRFVMGYGIAEADSRLRVGGYVDLKLLGPLFSGKYYVSEVKHVFDGTRGIRTEFIVERPGIG